MGNVVTAAKQMAEILQKFPQMQQQQSGSGAGPGASTTVVQQQQQQQSVAAAAWLIKWNSKMFPDVHEMMMQWKKESQDE